MKSPQLHIIALLALAPLLCRCASGPGKTAPGTQADSLVAPDPAAIGREIEELRREAAEHPGNAEIHRRLAADYRLLGTPSSRLRSLGEIDAAIALEPDNPRLHVERGLTQKARRFIGEAEASFRAAVRLDPDCFDGWYHLARISKEEYLRTMCFPQDLATAIDCFRAAHLLNPRHKDTLFNLAFLSMLRSMLRTARNHATKALESYPDDARLHLLLGAIDLEQLKFNEAEHEFDAALGLIDDIELARYEDVSVLLPRTERQLYETYPAEARCAFNRRFWIENDPTPATELNERRLEHVKRVFLAEELLSNEYLGRPGSETARGTAIICYGLPHRKLYNLLGGFDGPLLVWRYQQGVDSLTLYFQDEFLSGDFHFPIGDYGNVGELSTRTLGAVPQFYQFPVACLEFDAAAGLAQARAEGGLTAITVAVALPDSVFHRSRARWEAMLAIRDFNARVLCRDARSFRSDTLRSFSKRGDRYRIVTFRADLPPVAMQGRFAVEVVEEGWRHHSAVVESLTIVDFSGGDLQLSGANLTLTASDGSCSSIPDPLRVYGTEERLCVTYDVYNLTLARGRYRYRISYTIRRIERIEDKSGIAKTLSYITASIRGKQPGEEPSIMSSFEHESAEPAVHDRLQIDIGALAPNRYRIVLALEDLNGGGTATAQAEFAVTE